jgi:hypothetical protein
MLFADAGEVLLEVCVGHGVEVAHHDAPCPMPVTFRQFEEGDCVDMIAVYLA